MEESIGAAYREAQQSVIGSILIDPEHTLGPVMDVLTPQDLDGEYRTVFTAVRTIWGRLEPVDPVTVLAEVGDGYEPLLRRCMQLTPTAANAAAYAALVRQQARLIALRETGARLAGAVDEDEARKILAGAEQLLMQRSRDRVYSIQRLLEDFYRSMDAPAPNYLPWGVKALDEKLTAEPGDLVILGADSSVGKTAFALQTAWVMAARGYRVGFFSLETKSAKLANRLVSQRARLDSEAIKRRRFADQDYRDVAELGTAARKLHLDVIEASGFDAEDLRAATVAGQYQVIFVDYLQLLSGQGKDRPEIVANLSIAVHTMAQDLGVAVVALSQITPADKTEKARRMPGKEALRESRQLIHDADIILMMSLEDPEDNTSLRWLTCRKNKEGELPSVCLKFDPKHMDFTATDSRAIHAWQARPKRATFRDLPDDDQDKMSEVFSGGAGR